ncbi:MAG: MBL fold metallo-hydrolase [Verrucomicrobiota bacterium]|jgi:hydroxyacylglutathione hydrolase
MEMDYVDVVLRLPLEDGACDILKKALDIKRWSTSALSSASGVEWARIERILAMGDPTPEELAGLAGTLGLRIEPLLAIQAGWRPGPRTLPWLGICGFATPFLDWTVNSFVVWDPDEGTAGVVDTGTDASPMLEFLEARGLGVSHIFLTHGHSDHVSRLQAVRERYPDAEVWHGVEEQVPCTDGRVVRAGMEAAIGRIRVRVLETPGHTPGSLTFWASGWPEESAGVAFVGDLVFAGSIGRPSHSYELLQQSLHEGILRLPGETLLGCGHGPYTTVAEELEGNPVVNALL